MSTITIEPASGWRSLQLHELWSYRELLYFLAWRDVKVRYKQTLLGAAWALLQPLLLMVIFSVVFGRLAGIPSQGVPYPVFALTALVPWTLFAQSVAGASVSLVGSSSLVTKVYFPRLVIPLAIVASHLVGFAIALGLLLAAIAYYGIDLNITFLALPLASAFAVAATLSFSIGLAALNVRYRDVGHAVPFLVQVLLFVSPVAYSTNELEGPLRLIYAVNPMAGVIEGFRWSLLGASHDPLPVIIVSAISTLVLLGGATIYFKRVEKSFADVI